MFPTSLAERNICASLRFRFKEISEKYYISSVWRIVLDWCVNNDSQIISFSVSVTFEALTMLPYNE